MELADNKYKIIAVDFDGTLCFSNWPELGAPNTRLLGSCHIKCYFEVNT